MEHPRASTSDDVECFFSVLRDMVGKDFTHKKVWEIPYLQAVHLILYYRLCMDGDEHVWSSPRGWIQICHFFITPPITSVSMREKCWISATQQSMQSKDV